MAGLQSFINAPGLAEEAAPANLGSTGQDLASFGQAALGVSRNLMASKAAASKAAREAANLNTQVQADLLNEGINREAPLDRAVENGFISREQASGFGKDIDRSLALLDQAGAAGMGRSPRQALQRSLLKQRLLMQNPAAISQINSAFGSGDEKPGQATLTQLRAVEEKQYEETADSIRERLDAEGDTSYYGMTNEELIEIYPTTPYAQRDAAIKQSERRALATDVSIQERSPAVSRSLSYALSDATREMQRMTAIFRDVQGKGTVGTDGTSQGLPEQLEVYRQTMVAAFSEKYPDHPNLIQTFASSLGQMSGGLVTAQKDNLNIFNSEATAGRQDSEKARLENTIKDQIFGLSQNPTQALANSLRYEQSLLNYQTDIARGLDSVRDSLQRVENPNLAALYDNPARLQTVALLAGAGTEKSTILNQRLLQPDRAKAREAANEAAGLVSFLSGRGLETEADRTSFNTAMISIAAAHEMQQELSPQSAQDLEIAVRSLAEDKNFVDLVAKSPSTRRLAKPYAAALSQDLIKHFSETFSEIATDRVNLMNSVPIAGRPVLTVGLYRKLGQDAVIDLKATNSTGVPQLRLADGIENLLSPEEVAQMQTGLDWQNTQLASRFKPADLAVLRDMTGAGTVGQALVRMTQRADAFSLSTLDPVRQTEGFDAPVDVQTASQTAAPAVLRPQADLINNAAENAQRAATPGS